MESELERITRDLQIPMLADIRRGIQQVQARENGDRIDESALQQAVRAAIREELDARGAQGRGTVRELIEGRISSSHADGSDAVQQGRVSFDMLVEEEEILGEGTFGVVYSGEYMGKAVAIKKARGIIGDAAVLRAFRSAFLQSTGIRVPVAQLGTMYTFIVGKLLQMHCSQNG